jgi:cell division protein FtsN
VVKPTPGDNLYRVQVGPYSNDDIADAAKAALDHDGFKAIIKH